jgi:hypothetical protein
MRTGLELLVMLGLLLAAGHAGAAGSGGDAWEDEAEGSGSSDPFAGFDDDDWDDPWATRGGGLSWSGFVEGGLGARWNSVDNLDRLTLGDLRFRAETRYDHGAFRVDFKGDLLWDEVVEDLDAQLRELAASFSPASNVDVKLGRQVLTWGTGDLLFLNDLFPKDFISFFAGRDEDYLKSPSDTARVSVFTTPVNFDLAYTPRFTPDDYLYGERFAFWNPALGEVAAPARPRRADEPANGELALRLFRTVGATEYAVYGYRGRWKQPVGLDDAGMPRFPRLQSWGASMRMPLHKGIFNTEAAYYDSRDDRNGDDPRTPNSELRLLAGYEQELVRNLTAGTQLYAERIMHHDRLVANSLDPDRERDRWRTVTTLRLSYRALQDTLTSSLFVFVSPSDEDFYLRPSIAWRRDDHWLLAAGLNLFGGSEEHTFFGQLEDNSNGWLRLRYNY